MVPTDRSLLGMQAGCIRLPFNYAFPDMPCVTRRARRQFWHHHSLSFHPVDCMASETPEPAEAESGTGEIRDLLSQGGTLADRVSKLREGPRNENLRTVLLELQAIADRLESEARGE
jgi:hypothetical protein